MGSNKRSHTSALLLRSFATRLDTTEPSATQELLTQVVDESLCWQDIASQAASVELQAHMAANPVTRGRFKIQGPDNHRQYVPPREPNRLNEILGLMGSIGEQLSLAWTAEQDFQRVMSKTAADLDEDYDHNAHRMHARAFGELTLYYVLGASHSIGNLILRLQLLDENCAEVLAVQFSPKGRPANLDAFAPGSEDRRGWRTLNKELVAALKRSAEQSDSAAMREIVQSFNRYYNSRSYQWADKQRGLDFHRRRPQSVPHTAPRGGTVQASGMTMRYSMRSPTLDPLAETEGLVSNLRCLVVTLSEHCRAIRPEIANYFEYLGIYCAARSNFLAGNE